MNPGGSRTARLSPVRAKNQHLKQEDNPKKQQTYPQTTSYTATPEGGSILDENPGGAAQNLDWFMPLIQDSHGTRWG